MRILSLDLATKTGWALWDGARIESGMQDFTPQRGESPGLRYYYFNRWLLDMAVRFDGLARHPRFDLIIIEQNFRRGGHATEVAMGLSTRVHELCATTSPVIEFGQVNAMTLKKWATGSGKADKEMMKLRALGIKYPDIPIPAAIAGAMLTKMDDNEADALCILKYALEKFGGDSCNVRLAAAAVTE